MNRVTSADGTEIAWQVSGTGPALVLVVGAFCDSSTTRGLTELLASEFTVYEYDRRGRGESGNVSPYSPEKEAQDLAAVLAVTEEAGGPFVYGHSSGGIIALDAAAMGAPTRGVLAFEPPFTSADGEPHDELLAAVEDDLAADDLDGAARAFLLGSGAPAQVVDTMAQSPWWPGMRAMAPTLAYDLTLTYGGVVPAERYSAIRTPVTVLWGGASPAWAATAAAAVAAAIPGAQAREVPGQSHAVDDQSVAAILRTTFLNAPEAPTSLV